jgi:SAM-dependent methyltransferase
MSGSASDPVAASAVDGPAFYDDERVFANYAQLRAHPDCTNDTLEWPVMSELLGPLAGLRVLDLGCGDALFGRRALDDGAASYLGVDGSANMVAAARRTLADSGGAVVQASLLDWQPPEAAFDLVASRLALHYLPALAPLFARVFDALVPGGRFVYSVEHPVLTSCQRDGRDAVVVDDWVVDDYFRPGPRVTRWLGAEVLKYHRTVEDHFRGLNEAGFVVEQLRESRPQARHFSDPVFFERRQRYPLFLFLAARRP